MSRRVDPANPSLETHHLAGDPESRLAKANEADSAPPTARPPSRRFVSSEPRIVGRIAGSSGLPAPPPGPPPRWIAADQPPTPSEPGGDSGGSRQPKSPGWRFWRRRENEIPDEATSAPGVADAGAPDPASDREAGLAAAFAAAFRPGPESPPTEGNEEQPPPDPAPPPPAPPEPNAQLEPDADVDAKAAVVSAGAAVAQADVDEADIEPTADAAIDEADIEPTADTDSQPVAAEPEAVVAEAERQPEPEPEASVASEAETEPEASVASEAETEPEASVALEAEAEPEAEPAAEPEPMASVAPEAEAEPETSVAPEASVAREAEPEPEAEPEAVVSTVEAAPAASVTTAEAEPQAEPQPTTAAAARKRPSRRVLVAGGIAALVAAVGIGTGIAVTSGSSQPARQSSSARAAPTTVSRAPTAPSAGPTRPAAPIEPATIVDARAWLKANIARNQRISADPNLVGGLLSAGFAAAHAAPSYPGASDWHADSIIISTPQTRARAASAPELNAELAASIPVAVFGTGTQTVEARMVFGTSNPDVLSVQAQRQDDATNRRLAGQELLRNPRVTIPAAWSTLVSTGGLDLRASVVIGLLAARTNVAVVAVVVDQPENAAGTPARTVLLSIPPSVLPGIIATLPAGYRPDRISSPTQHNVQLTQLSWGVTLTPQPTLS